MPGTTAAGIACGNGLGPKNHFTLIGFVPGRALDGATADGVLHGLCRHRIKAVLRIAHRGVL